MASESRSSNSNSNSNSNHHHQTERQKGRSVFELPIDILDSCRLLGDGSSSSSSSTFQSGFSETSSINAITDEENPKQELEDKLKKIALRWSCNTCKVEFDSLLDQRSHFKSDLHRFNVKLSIAGKNTIKEEDFDELDPDSLFKDDDISSISGSEDETEKDSFLNYDSYKRAGESVKRKLFYRLHTGEIVSIWKCLLLNESEDLSVDNDKLFAEDNGGGTRFLKENELFERLKSLIHEPRDKSQLRIVLLASGGHFAGCVFDGNSIVAHKTFHRYVVRAKSGKKQSTKDATGKAANSAGSNLRRYNELALKKEIQELLAAWKPYFELSCCTYINSPSNNRQLLFSGDKSYFSDPRRVVRYVPFVVRRPTCKEVKRVYDRLTNMVYEVNEPEKGSSQTPKEDKPLCTGDKVSGNLEESHEEQLGEHLGKEIAEACQDIEISDELSISNESEVLGVSTPLHEAATSNNAQQTLDLLEQGLDPSAKDERGRTPYMLANDKEVRNTFRRFMALNLDKWDWHAAKVPSPLTKEMEESQAAKQAEKDAKRKAKAKELKKLRKAKEKAQAQAAAVAQTTPKVSQGQGSVSKLKPRLPPLSKEEELKRAQAADREKRAAAAEKRMAAAAAAAAAATGTSNTQAAVGTSNTGAAADGITCSCCNVSLAGIVPFHRYNYKYCSTSCMHVHREILEDG